MTSNLRDAALKILRIVWPIWTLFVLAIVVFVRAGIVSIASLIVSVFCTAFVWLVLPINPGSGPVDGATKENAEVCIRQFIVDLKLAGVTYEYIGPGPDGSSFDGRFEFNLNLGGQNCSVDMPGIPLERVRYIDRQKQNIWDFPRLYVEGSSWVWVYAISQARSFLCES